MMCRKSTGNFVRSFDILDGGSTRDAATQYDNEWNVGEGVITWVVSPDNYEELFVLREINGVYSVDLIDHQSQTVMTRTVPRAVGKYGMSVVGSMLILLSDAGGVRPAAEVMKDSFVLRCDGNYDPSTCYVLHDWTSLFTKESEAGLGGWDVSGYDRISGSTYGGDYFYIAGDQGILQVHLTSGCTGDCSDIQWA